MTVEDWLVAIADLAEMKDAAMREAMLDLIKKGLIADSGKRRNGRIVWIAVKHAKRH